jgi:hypothetical protein
LYGGAFEPTLPAVTHEAMAAMAVVDVRAKQSGHNRRQLARIAQSDQ